MPATKKRKPRARRSPPGGRFRLPQLEQRHLDLIGLGLVAGAVFFAFLIYLRWDGGEAGGWAVDGLRRLIGAVYYVVPVALLATGAILVLREMLPAVRPFRSGGLCLFLALSRSAWPRGRSVSAPAARRCAGTPTGCAARRPGRGGAVLGDLDRPSGWSARTSWRCSCSWPPSCCSPAPRSPAWSRRPPTRSRRRRATCGRRSSGGVRPRSWPRWRPGEPRVSRGTPPADTVGGRGPSPSRSGRR